MGILFRKSFKAGPLKVNMGKRGLTSWGWVFGPLSWNSRTKAWRIDLPGPFSWTSKKSTDTTWFTKTMMVVMALIVVALVAGVFYIGNMVGL